MRIVRLLSLELLTFVFCTAMAFAAEGDFILKGEKAFLIKSGKKTLVKDCITQSVRTDAGIRSWILVDAKDVEGAESGIYLFMGKENRPAGFLPIKEEVSSCDVVFSPSGEKLLISRNKDTGYIKLVSLYFLDKNKGLVKKASFEMMGLPVWIDYHRFVFTSVDSTKKVCSENQCTPWNSVALYDSAVEDLIFLKKATATAVYTFLKYDKENDSVEIYESSVRNEKDWYDEDKIRYTTFTLPIPAAG